MKKLLIWHQAEDKPKSLTYETNFGPERGLVSTVQPQSIIETLGYLGYCKTHEI